MKRVASAAPASDRAPRVHVDDRAPLREADVHEAVVQVRAVGAVQRLPVLEPLGDDERRVDDRHREHEQREEQRRRSRPSSGGPGSRRVASTKPSSMRARVAHEDPRRDRSCGAGSRGTRRRRSPRGSPASGLPSESAMIAKVDAGDRADRRPRARPSRRGS